MPAGRPRTVSLPPDQMVDLGIEMIDWILENEPLHLSQWYCIEKGYTDKEFDTMHVAPEFFPYYEKALKIIGLQYLCKHSDIEPSLKHRWQRVYFKDLKRQEDEDMDADAERKVRVLKSEARAIEEERKKVLSAVSRKRKAIQ